MPSLLTSDLVNKTPDGTALHGYDPVAYFVEGRPRPGREAFMLKWKGAKWHFATAENRESFAEDPERYAPQYGGYCAFAASLGQRADVSPKAWQIVDGKLYLNNNRLVHMLWKVVPLRIERANHRWGAAHGGKERTGSSGAS